MTVDLMTLEFCANFHKSNNARYFAVTLDGAIDLCDSYTTLGSTPAFMSLNCNTPCAGHSAELCGSYDTAGNRWWSLFERS